MGTATKDVKQQGLPLISRPIRSATPLVVVPGGQAKPSEIPDWYWRFAAERQAIFFRRFHQQPCPWTQDFILLQFRFTNVYRASDRVSQYLIRNVIYTGEHSAEDLFFRIILFKLFNRIETWELLVAHCGEVHYATYASQTTTAS